MAKKRWQTTNESNKLWWLYIPKKAKTFPGQTSKALIWLSPDSTVYQREKKLQQNNSGLEPTKSSNMEERVIYSQSSGQTGSVGVILLRQGLSHFLWFMSSLSGCSTSMEVQPIPQTIDANIITLQRGVRVGRVTEDEMAWGGLTQNKPICFHVCPLGWLLALTQLLHNLQADAKHKHIKTTGLKT